MMLQGKKYICRCKTVEGAQEAQVPSKTIMKIDINIKMEFALNVEEQKLIEPHYMKMTHPGRRLTPTAMWDIPIPKATNVLTAADIHTMYTLSVLSAAIDKRLQRFAKDGYVIKTK